MISLFKYYPLLKDKLPYVSLGDFPTPIEKLERLGKDISLNQLFIKRDDLSGKFYGGNICKTGWTKEHIYANATT
jgi:hypothetical protein